MFTLPVVFGDRPDGSEINLTKKNSRSLFDIREDTDQGPHIQLYDFDVIAHAETILGGKRTR